MLEIDHLVVAASDLESGTRWLEERLGVPLVAGGQHALMGTHNRLLRLDGGANRRLYLELIALDPAAQAPSRPRWFGLDDPALQVRLQQRPHLIHWLARSGDIARDLRPWHGEILSMQRGDYRWRISVPANGGLPGEGVLPSLIQWDVAFHPAERLPPSACRLMKLEAFHPEPSLIKDALAELEVGRHVALFPGDGNAGAELVAYLATPRGLVELD